MAVKIERVDLFPMRYPMNGYFKFFAGPGGAIGRAAIAIKITADDGTIGWGQSVPLASWSDETPETALVALDRYFAPTIIGCDADDLATAMNAMDRAIAPGFSTGMPIARAGIDLALHDLVGHARKQTLAQMWGLAGVESIPLSWTVNVQKLDDIAALIEEGQSRGYRNFNIKVAPDPEFDVALAREVRRLAPQTFLWADANGGYTLDAALEAAPRLAEVGVDVLESPLRPNQISGYQKLRRQNALPILMDEGVTTPTDLREFHQAGMLDGVAMKPPRCGGLLSCKAQIEYCIASDILWLGSGLTDPDISLAATIATYAAFGLNKPAALNGPQFITGDVLAVPLRIEQDRAYAPTGFGLGIEVDEDKVVELMKRSGGDKLLHALKG